MKWMLVCALGWGLSGCCFFPAPEEESDDTADEAAESQQGSGATDGISIDSVVFARELDDQWQPVGGPVTEFRADETTVWARVTIDGRPSSGVVTMRWMWRDLEIATADIELSDVNGGLLFSFGQDTFIRGYMTTQRLYIGQGHRLVLMHGTTELGSYPFRVVPPNGARPSRFVSAGLYANFDPNAGPSGPTTTFGPADTVFVAGQVALGHASWFDARFTINGEVDNAMTQETIGEAGGGDVTNFIFRGTPSQGAWPPGAHRVDLILDDQEVAHYDFTVAAGG